MNLNFKFIVRIVGVVNLLTVGAMFPALVVSLICAEYNMTAALGVVMAVLLVAGLLLSLATGNARSSNIRVREGLLVVAICWILLSALGALPYVVSGEMRSFADAFFESVSSFSTSGASMIPDPSALPRSLLFWRSLSNWVGGMGILVLAISILPAFGFGAANIVNAETAAPTTDKIRTRMSDNAKSLFLIYLSLTAIEFLLLLVGGMNPYEAVIHAFGSMANGGLSNYADGIKHFNSVYIEVVISVFCILASLNFVSYRLIARRRFRDFFKEPEIRLFFIILASILVLTILVLMVKEVYATPGEAIRYGLFQAVAFVTTAGYANTDYGAWPGFCKALMFLALFIGGCSASTAGGVKVIRLAVILALVRRNVYKRLHPNAVVAVKLGEQSIAADRVSNITVYVFVYLMVFAAGSLLLSLDGQGVTTSVSAALAALSNAGLGFGRLGITSGFEIFSTGGRLLLSLLMLIGRLEIFTIILLLTPTFWRPNR
ncbi:MAG: TrkH family potassium uptake protein [Clostridiales Family XIII bacterium]|jgi:trk system potassium uptake protein TrkH|nr:TrkH family potassium uptake protein [Clostridiales Family XIII bacterium]